MLTLNHIREHIVDKYKNINVDIVEPLSYIKTLAEPKGNTLLIYTKVKRPTSTKFEINDVIDEDITTKLDVTGTPLEDDCEITVISDWSLVKKLVKTNPWTDEEEHYSTVGVDLAIDLINGINIEKGNACDDGSIFVICDGVNDDKQFLLEVEFSKDYNWRGIAKFTGLIPFKEIDIPASMKKHLNCLRNCDKVNTMIETYFNIKTNQTIKFSWETSSLTPSIKCKKNADVVISQSIPIGDLNSIIEEFWRQLEIMEGLKQDIIKYKKSENNADLVFNQSGSSLELNKINEHILNVLSNFVPFESPYTATDTFDVNSIISRMDTHRIFNVTDQLWSVLRFCSSYKDLLSSLNYIFQCAAQSIVVNMPKNKNRLARLIRDISEKRVIPRLAGSEPLEILLEIGLEKISRDYEHIFIESKLCSPTAYQAFMQDVAERVPLNDRKTLHHAVEANRKTLMNKNKQLDITKLNTAEFDCIHFNIAEVERNLGKLGQLHLILEHIILMQANLNLDHTVFGSIMNNLSKQELKFSRLKASKFDKREFPIAASKILSKIENHNPQVIKISMKSENQFKSVNNTFFFSVDPICPLNVFPYMQNSEEIISKDVLYCGLHYTKIGSRMK